MSVFFMRWELWQKMTFVLACCIVLVFAFGFARQWRTNRVMRRLEVMDEEKRARLSIISHCGIEALRPPEIPFGIRALQSGIRVDGIWIARSHTPDSRHTLPPATPVAHHISTPKGKANEVNPVSTNSPSTYPTFKSSRRNYMPVLDLSCRVPSAMPSEPPKTPRTSSSHRPDPALPSPEQCIKQNPLIGPSQDKLWSGRTATPSFRNPFVVSTQASAFSLNNITGTSSELESPKSNMIPVSRSETYVDRCAARANCEKLISPAGFKPEVRSQVVKKACSGDSWSPYQRDVLPTRTKILSPCHKIRKERASGSGHIASKSSNST